MRPTYGRLFRSRAGLSGHAVDFCFALEAVGFGDQPRRAVDAILADVPAGTPGREALLAVSAIAPAPPEPAVDPALQLVRALERQNDGDLDEAFRLAVLAPHGFSRTALLVRIAAEVETIDTASAALQALDESSREDLERLGRSASLGPAVEKVHALGEPRPDVRAQRLPGDWFEWFERLGGSEPWSGAVTAASAGENDWDIRAATATPGDIDRFTSLVGYSRPDWGQRAFRDGAPFLVRALGAVEPGPALRPVHEALFLQIATDPDVSGPQWTALADLTELQASYGLDASSYAQQVDVLGELLEPLASAAMVLPAMTFLERLCDLACPSRESRLRFATRVQAMLFSLHGKVDRSDLLLFAVLGRSIGLEVEVAPLEVAAETEGSLEPLRGRTVALYSLNASALERARSALVEEVPELIVKCFSDLKGGGAALAQAAKTADLFVISTAAATHSATGFIEQHRGDLPKRRVHRQGASALLGAVRAYAEEVGRAG